MTELEALNAVRDLTRRKIAQEQEIVANARSLVATLKDAGRNAAAEELASRLFQLDAIEGEMTELIRKDPASVVKYILQGMRPPT
jgi:hypothetical protein